MKRLKGFTLVELVITIAIVIILSVISVPIYRGYVDKAKMAEGYALIGQILSCQKNYYSEYGIFLDDNVALGRDCVFTNNDPVLGIDARGNKYFTWFNYNFLGYDGLKQSINIFAKLPSDIIKEDSKPYLKLYYNITTGAKYSITSYAVQL